ncbi:Peptide/nickel transport system substrate-binding protein [Hyphomicrobiales bacterium]|nr:Peptide/nickel transport system substrate-binding protein [Hyphomicrobiales bacterium]
MEMKYHSLLAAALIALPFCSGSATAEPKRGGIINVATVGEPPTLDPMVSTADLVGIVSQHIFETLYTFGKDWKITPLLAEALPEISPDGKVYTIKLRDGIAFHDGGTMTSRDVVASLKRWMENASRGKQTASNIASIEPVDDLTVKITLKEAYAPLAALLAFNNSAAIVLKADNQAVPLAKVAGTGPYALKERKADQYIQLTRFDGYKSRAGEADFYGGARKQYLDEIRFVPVPDPNTRVEGAVAGQFSYADSLPVESFDRLKTGKSTPVVLKSFGWPVFVMNTKEGIMSKLETRQAVQAALDPNDMLLAAFGSKDFYEVDGALYPKGFIWHTDAGTKLYNQANPERAKSLLDKAGYKGEPLVILTSRQYEFHYKMAQVAKAYLEQAGFKVDMQVVDWATLTQRRADPKLWSIYITHSPFLPEPALSSYMSDASPGWWSTPAKQAAIGPFNTAVNTDERVKLFAKVQETVFAEAPLYKVGNFNALYAQAPNLKGVEPAPWPFFWNASLD